jgi:predicted AlkP superfamily pyrophosphatase or phosphodiesterase
VRQIVFIWAALLCGCASVLDVPAPTAAPSLILVSIDGFRPDYLDRGMTPNLSALARDGVRAEMRPSFPSLTFPNHYALVTGLRPDRNGIVNNQMEDPDHPGVVFTLRDRAVNTLPYWWEDATPLWVSAEQQGVRSATMFWPGSEVAIHGIRPRDWVLFDQALPSSARVDTVLQWLDRPASERPRFITLYFDTVDTAGHRFGPDSAELNVAVEDVDRAIGLLLEGLSQRGLRDNTNIVIVSDHGMTPISAEQTVDMDAIVPPGRLRYVWPPSQLAGIAPNEGETAEVEAAVLGRHGHVECWRRGALPAAFHGGRHRRTPPIVCMADVGWTLLSSAYPRPYPVSGGAHGYDPDDPSMAALFLAQGPAFARDVRLQPFDNVDVYPLLANLIIVTPTESIDGDLSALRSALSQAADAPVVD